MLKVLKIHPFFGIESKKNILNRNLGLLHGLCIGCVSVISKKKGVWFARKKTEGEQKCLNWKDFRPF